MAKSMRNAPDAERFLKSVTINAPPSAVWTALTDIDTIPLWMADPEMNLKVVTSWSVGDSITITGTHHEPFINIGNVQVFDPEKQLCYSHLSSASNLPDVLENHSILRFDLARVSRGTSLTLTIENFPTDVIFKHLEFYWSSTLELFKRFVESELPAPESDR